MQSKEIIGVKEIMAGYGLTQHMAIRLVQLSGLALPRHKNEKYRVFREAWEKWLSKEYDR